MMTSDKFITVDELCSSLGIGKNTAYGLLERNEIKAFRIGRTWKIPKDAVDIYIKRKLSLTKPFTTRRNK